MSSPVQNRTIPNESNFKEIREASEKLKAVESGELQSFLDWMSDQSDIYYPMMSGNNTREPISIKDISTTTENGPAPANQACEEGYMLVPEDDLLADQFVRSHPESQQSQGVIAKLKNTFWKTLGYKS